MTATVNANYGYEGTGLAIDTNGVVQETSMDLSINGVTFQLESNSEVSAIQNLETYAAALNAESGVTEYVRSQVPMRHKALL